MKLLSKFINGVNLMWILMFTVLFTGSHLTNLQSQLVSSGLILALSFIYLLQNKSVRIEKFDLFALGFLFFFNLSLFFNQTPYGFKEFITFNGGFVIYFLVKNWQSTKFEIDLNSTYFRLSLLALSILLLVNLNNFLISPNDRFAGFFFGDQAYSTYPNVLANFLLFLIPINYYLYLKENFFKNRTTKLIYLFTLIVFLTSFWLAASRTTILALILVLGLSTGFLLIKYKKLSSLLKNLSLAILTILLTFFLSLIILDTKTYNLNYSSRITPNQDISAQKSVNERFILFQNAFQIGKDNPFLGTGPGSFQFINPRYQASSLVNSEHPHNIFLKIFAENGVFAVVFFIFWIFCLIFNSFKTVISSQNTYFFILFITKVGLLLTLFFDYNLGFSIIFILFFAILGLTSNFELRNVSLSKIPLLNFQPAIKIIITILIPLFFYQSYIFITLNQLESSDLQANETLFIEKFQIVHSAPLAFKNDYLNVLDQSVFAKQYLNYFYEATLKWPNYSPSYLFLANASIDTRAKLQAINTYLNLDYYNNFSAHLMLVQFQEPSLEYLSDLKSILADYNYLLSINAHNTVATQNPIFVYQIYEFLASMFPQDQILLAQFESFKNIYFAEMVKFDTRFSTNLLNNYYQWKSQNS